MPPQLERWLQNPTELLRQIDREKCERSLSYFFQQAWRVIDPAEYMHGWHIDAMAEHLEAVSYGEIKRLVINIPPRHCKSLLVSVAWPAWLWTQTPDKDFPLLGAHSKFLCMSYSGEFALDHAALMRKLIMSEWYQDRWGDKVNLTGEQEAKGNFANQAGGRRFSGGINGIATGRGGDIKIIDDPHKVKEAESDVVRRGVIKTYDETLRNRVTSPKNSAEVIVMQRITEDDLSGHIISQNEPDTVHLMLPAEHDVARHCVTRIGWEDPRTEDYEPLWPNQWGAEQLAPFKNNSFQWAGQYQQTPVPRGGGIIKRETWQLWPPEGEEESWTRQINGKPAIIFPDLDYVLVSVDTAYTEKEENDPSACTVWGVFMRKGQPKIILMDAWRERLEFHALVQKIIKTCRVREADALLVEAKASGQSVIQEIRRLVRDEEWQTHPAHPDGDKVARLHSVQGVFEGGVIYAPDRRYAEMVIDEVSAFPKGRYKDLTDSTSQAIKFMRKIGLAQLASEIRGPAPFEGIGQRSLPYDI